MRTFVLFSLALAGTAVVVDDVSAGPFRRTSSSAPTTAYYPAPVPATVTPGTAPAPVADGKPPVVMTSEGTIYRLGSDGNYYAAGSGISATGGYRTPGMYSNGRYMTNGVYPAGYYGSPYGYPAGVYPAGGAQTMPGVNIGPGGATIVPGTMPPRK